MITSMVRKQPERESLWKKVRCIKIKISLHISFHVYSLGQVAASTWRSEFAYFSIYLSLGQVAASYPHEWGRRGTSQPITSTVYQCLLNSRIFKSSKKNRKELNCDIILRTKVCLCQSSLYCPWINLTFKLENMWLNRDAIAMSLLAAILASWHVGM
jgi:glycogen debranching enzyme